MSSYEVGNVSVSGGLLEGAASIAAAAAIIAPAAIIGGTGYAVYKFGKSVQEELEREHREAVEREARKVAEEKVRKEIAQHQLMEAIDRAKSVIKGLDDDALYADAPSDIKERLYNLRQYVYGLTENISSSKTEDIEYDATIIASRVDSINNELESLQQLKISMDMDKRISESIDVIAGIFRGLDLLNYKEIINVVATDPYEDKKNAYLDQVRELAVYVKSIIYKEIKRFERIPSNAVDVETLASILKGLDRDLYTLLTEDIEVERYKTRISNVKNRIEEYKNLCVLMDKDEEAFLSAYYSYKEACEKVHIEAKDMMDFDSYNELQEEIELLRIRLKRMEKCSDLIAKFGRDTYLCMAMEYELHQLEYGALSKDESEQLLDRELRNATVGDKLSPFYIGEKESLMQIYKTDDDVLVQVEIHKDGRTSVETIVNNEMIEQDAIEKQRKHCVKSKKLEKALSENWFIETNLVESDSETIVEHSFGVRDKYSEERMEKDSKAKNERLLIAQKEAEKKRKEKAKVRAMALRG